jgi:hypothetical protein
MLHRQFESELAHLELIVPLLATQATLGLPYWRRRILALSPAEGQPLDSSKRLGRLLSRFEAIELAASLVQRVVVVRRHRR